jgi:Nuclease-related domain
MIDFDRLRPSAGRYAERRYRHARRRWRRRVVQPYRWVFLVTGAGIFTAELATRPDLLDWMLGLAMGGLVGLWVTFNDSPPPYVENWRRGADGERRTASVMRRLRRKGWRCVHDLQAERGNRDHVAVGPAGVFLLETKRPHGEVVIEDGSLWVNRIDDPDASAYSMPELAGRVRGEASRLSAELGEATGRRPWVHAVVVIWAPFPQTAIECDRVAYVHGDELKTWLASRPERLNGDAQRQLVEAVRNRATGGRGPGAR